MPGPEHLAFFQEFLERPLQVASVVPSSRFLERRLVRVSGAHRASLLVELGPGTGGTTRALLQALPETGRLLAIEANERFAALLDKNPDERLIVHRGRAQDLSRILAEHGLDRPNAVISGIPFSTLSPSDGDRVVREVAAVIAPGGCFVAYQVRGHVHDVARPILGAARIEVELRNVPPARIFVWRTPVAPA